MWAIVGGFSWCPNWPVIWTDLIVTVSFVGGLIAAIWVLYVLTDRTAAWYYEHEFTALGRGARRVGYGFRYLWFTFLGLGVLFMVSVAILALIQRWFPCN